MTTELLYLDDPHSFECEATIQSTGSDDRGEFVVLDRTVAYPQGGGQPADRGYLYFEQDSIPLDFVGFRCGDVLHYIAKAAMANVSVGQKISVRIDQRFRLNSARLHTGGHLLSHVIEEIEPKLVPTKAYHFPNGAYVEFVNDQCVDVPQLLDAANQAIGEAIVAGLTVRTSYSSFDEVKKIRPSLAPFIPLDKPTRIVSIGEFTPLPCGGTHLLNLTLLGALRITKTKQVKENTRVSYAISAPEDGA